MDCIADLFLIVVRFASQTFSYYFSILEKVIAWKTIELHFLFQSLSILRISVLFIQLVCFSIATILQSHSGSKSGSIWGWALCPLISKAPNSECIFWKADILHRFWFCTDYNQYFFINNFYIHLILSYFK